MQSLARAPLRMLFSQAFRSGDVPGAASMVKHNALSSAMAERVGLLTREAETHDQEIQAALQRARDGTRLEELQGNMTKLGAADPLNA